MRCEENDAKKKEGFFFNYADIDWIWGIFRKWVGERSKEKHSAPLHPFVSNH